MRSARVFLVVEPEGTRKGQLLFVSFQSDEEEDVCGPSSSHTITTFDGLLSSSSSSAPLVPRDEFSPLPPPPLPPPPHNVDWFLGRGGREEDHE